MEHEAQSHLFVFIEAMEAYEGFYDSEWSNQEINKALHTPFYKPLFHLLFAWRGASYVRQMPVECQH
jgi:hypothetical protein